MFGSSSEGAGMVGLVIRLVFSLALVLGLLLLIAKVANRRFKARTGAPIQIVHRQQLSRSSSVAVVTVGTRVLVLGSTDQQVSLLTEVEPDEVGLDPETMLPEDSVESPLGAGRVPSPRQSNPAFRSLSGSILSPDTWRQTLAQLRGQPQATTYDDSAPDHDKRAS